MSNVKPSVPERPKRLSARLADACAAIPALPMLGQHPDYNYVKASQIFEAFRKELSSRGILVLPNELEITEKDVATPVGITLRQVTIRTEYEFRDTWLGGPGIRLVAHGVGIDAGDKGAYKAKTGSLKYLLKILGIIPWAETDDPESDASVDDITRQKVYADGAGAKTPKQRRVNDQQIRAFDSACHKSGKTADQVARYLRVKFSTATVADLPKSEFEEALRWALQDTDTMLQQLGDSLAAEKKSAGVEVPPAQAVAGD